MIEFIPFKHQMKYAFLFLFLFLSKPAFAEVTNIDCSNGQCVLSCGSLNPTCTGSTFTVDPTTRNCAGYDCVVGDIFSTISSTGQNSNPVNISTDLILKPQNVKISIQNGTAPGQDLTVNLNAKNPSFDYAASFTLFSDNLNQVSINLNGYSGKNGKDASEICADKIKNGDYGSGVQSFFNTRRASDPAINQNKCDLQDLNYMQQFSFTCDDPAFSEVSVSNPTVSVQRVKSKARCMAVGSYSDCVQRKVRVNCNFELFSTIKNRKFIEDDFANQSWIGTYDGGYLSPYSGTGEYTVLSQSTTYNLCASGQLTTCAGGTTLYPGSSNSYCSGYNGNISSYYALDTLTASQKLECNVVSIDPQTNTVSYFKQTTIANSLKRSYVPLVRSGTQLGPYDEAFFNAESNRLGGIGGFCQQYGLPNAVAQNPSAWYAGVPGYPQSQTVKRICYVPTPPPINCYDPYGGCFGGYKLVSCGYPNSYPYGNLYAYYDNAGIPWESTAQVNNVNWQSDTNAQHGIAMINGYARAAIWKGSPTGSSYTYTTEQAQDLGCFSPPVAPATQGSYINFTQTNCLSPNTWTTGPVPYVDNWNRYKSNTFEGCQSGYTTAQTNYITLIQYSNSATQCSNSTDPLDPNNRAVWQYTGMAQESAFGTESVSCSIGSCATNSSVSDLDRNIDVITPGSGDNGTEQGRGLIFTYDIKNLSQTALPGTAGLKGSPDLTINPQVRICAKIDDATAGINTPQAKNPFVSFRRYNWQSVKANNAGNNGVPPRQNGKKIEVFKKIDPGALYLLEKALN